MDRNWGERVLGSPYLQSEVASHDDELSAGRRDWLRTHYFSDDRANEAISEQLRTDLVSPRIF